MTIHIKLIVGYPLETDAYTTQLKKPVFIRASIRSNQSQCELLYTHNEAYYVEHGTVSRMIWLGIEKEEENLGSILLCYNCLELRIGWLRMAVLWRDLVLDQSNQRSQSLSRDQI